MERRLLLDVVIGQGSAIFQLLASEDQALLVRRDPLLILNLRLNIVDGVGGLNLQGDGLPGNYPRLLAAGLELKVEKVARGKGTYGSLRRSACLRMCVGIEVQESVVVVGNVSQRGVV